MISSNTYICIVLSKVLAENGGITSPECLKRAFIIEPVKPKAFPL